MPCVLTGLVNFERALGELYVELAPHPGGYGYFLFEEILSLRTCFRCRRRLAARELLQDVAVPIVTVAPVDASGGSEHFCVHMWVSCQETLMMELSYTMIV